jgi:hypothetical protein
VVFRAFRFLEGGRIRLLFVNNVRTADEVAPRMDSKHTAELKLLATEHHMVKGPGILVICLVNTLKGLLFEASVRHCSLQMLGFRAGFPLSLPVIFPLMYPQKRASGTYF